MPEQIFPVDQTFHCTALTLEANKENLDSTFHGTILASCSESVMSEVLVYINVK
jgi:hypothetical protein